MSQKKDNVVALADTIKTLRILVTDDPEALDRCENDNSPEGEIVLSYDEYARLCEKADAAGMGVSTYLRKTVLKQIGR